MAAFPWQWSPPDVAEVWNLTRRRSDGNLVEAVLVGDDLAAGALYDRLQPDIDEALRRVLQSRFKDFPGLVSQVFERMLRTLAREQREAPRHLRALAAAVAGRVALEALRKEFRSADSTSLSKVPRTVPNNSKRREIENNVRRSHDILVRMEPRLADVLILRDVLACAPADISRATAVGIRVLHTRLARARRELIRRAVSKTMPLRATPPTELKRASRTLLKPLRCSPILVAALSDTTAERASAVRKLEPLVSRMPQLRARARRRRLARLSCLVGSALLIVASALCTGVVSARHRAYELSVVYGSSSRSSAATHGPKAPAVHFRNP